MSFRALNWAKLQRVGHQPSKHLLLLLAEYADDAEECFPSQERLAAETEMTVRAVSSCLLRLEALGLVERRRSRRADGTLGVTRYRLRTDRTADPASLRADQAAEELPLVDAEEPPERRSGGCEPPERHDITTGTSFRSSIRKNLQKRTIEREARGSDERAGPFTTEVQGAFDPIRDNAFMAFVERWPSGRSDDLDPSHAAWLKLSTEDRKAALEGIDAFRMANKADGRRLMVSSAKYLRQRSWERLDGGKTAVAKTAPSTIGAFSRAWWFVFHRRRGAGEPVRAMLSQAAIGAGYSVPRQALPTETDERSLVKLGTGGAEFIAWRDYLAEEGLRLPDITVPFVWMPSPVPPALARSFDLGKRTSTDFPQPPESYP